jgi:hypothetical protein
MLGLLRVFLLVGFVVKFWWLILLVLVVVVVGVAAWCTRDASRVQLERARREQAALAARADAQHALILAGDDRRLYGDYTPKQID